MLAAFDPSASLRSPLIARNLELLALLIESRRSVAQACEHELLMQPLLVALDLQIVSVLVNLAPAMAGTDLFTQLGVDLGAMKIIVVKSSQHFYASYSKVAKHVIYVGAPGAVTGDLKTLLYTKIRRPKWPID